MDAINKKDHKPRNLTLLCRQIQLLILQYKDQSFSGP
ncbi:hypothetical protein T12_15470 [Trichinella patagoniensis]|uniref:Uncharacterized protein n=1 Tax=Trichinella patagoniensis TaxID=990121 RepID=A0A0V0YTB4_9BILA|nr:hypothetical protein T12_15470 [Trichinella patagoniensis]